MQKAEQKILFDYGKKLGEQILNGILSVMGKSGGGGNGEDGGGGKEAESGGSQVVYDKGNYHGG